MGSSRLRPGQPSKPFHGFECERLVVRIGSDSLQTSDAGYNGLPPIGFDAVFLTSIPVIFRLSVCMDLAKISKGVRLTVCFRICGFVKTVDIKKRKGETGQSLVHRSGVVQHGLSSKDLRPEEIHLFTSWYNCLSIHRTI